MRILTNFERFPETWTTASGRSGTACFAGPFGEIARRLNSCDVVVINCDVRLTLQLQALFWLAPWKRKPMVAVDLVLRKPGALADRLLAYSKKLLLSRVDGFLHYFKDLRGYRDYYGIGEDRSRYVEFKPNIRFRYRTRPDPDGQYVLCMGRSMRDYDTFFEAVATLPYEAAIPRPNLDELRTHQSRFNRPIGQLPPQVRVIEDDGRPESMISLLQGARLVVLPIRKDSICASGIGTYLNAMLMSKCVILSEGPGTSGVLAGQALVVPPEDPHALAAMIRHAWEDDTLRLATAERGYRYALGLGGEQELYQRILECLNLPARATQS
jgi:glycosyltransferase involved in cell wall biosynthesis